MGYVFDLDGTLVDSVPTLLRVINKVLEENSLPLSDRVENLSVAGWGLLPMFEKTLRNRISDEREIARMSSEMLILYREDPVTGTVPYPGAYDFLMHLSEIGEHTALITNKLLTPATMILDRCFPDFRFTRIYSPDEGWEPKPSNLSLQDFRRRYPEGLLTYVGDTELDYRTASNTADRIYLATWGYRGRDRLISDGFSEDILIDDFSQISE